MFAHIYIYVKICVQMCVCIYTHNLPKQLSKLPVNIYLLSAHNVSDTLALNTVMSKRKYFTNVNSLM